MPIETFDCEQNSPEWFEARKGIVTASCFADVLAKQRDPAKDGMRKKYLYKLAAEIITGTVSMEGFRNDATDRGHVWEIAARATYDMVNPNAKVTQVGFVKNGRLGASPDGLVDDHGVLEIKSLRGDLMVSALLRKQAGEQPLQVGEHMAQIQGEMLATERQWCDLVLFSDNLPEIITRVPRDSFYCTTLKAEIGRFVAELDQIVTSIRAM